MKDRKSTRLDSSHVASSYAVFCLKNKSNGTRSSRCAGALADPSPASAALLSSPPPPSPAVSLFCFLCYGRHLDLPSFPTRRSSDLYQRYASYLLGLIHPS